MSIFITQDEILSLGLDSYIFLCCTPLHSPPSEHILTSLLFEIPFKAQDFFQSLRTIVLPLNHTVICYDCSNYIDASQVCWGLHSVGFVAKVLIRVPQLVPVLPILPGSPPSASYNRAIFRQVNSKLLVHRLQLAELKHKHNEVRINYVSFCIHDNGGRLLGREHITEMMARQGWVLNSENVLLAGPCAAFGALLLRHVGQENVTLLLEDQSKGRSTSKDQEYENGTVERTTFNESELNYANTLFANSMESLIKSRHKVEKNTNQQGCGSCVAF
jgi:hypothetical protein